MVRDFACFSVLLFGKGANRLKDFRPAAAHIAEREIVARCAEARMDETDPCTARHFGKRPSDDCIQARPVLRVRVTSALPTMDQPFIWNDLQNLTMDNAVPLTSRRGLVGETIANDRWAS